MSKVTQLAAELHKNLKHLFSGHHAPGPFYKNNLERDFKEAGQVLGRWLCNDLVLYFRRGGD